MSALYFGQYRFPTPVAPVIHAKSCEPGCQKPCCVHKTTTIASTCPPGCTKPCCVKTVVTTSSTTVKCPPGCQKPCCVTIVDFVALGPCCGASGCGDGRLCGNGTVTSGALLQPVNTVYPIDVNASVTPQCNTIPTCPQPKDTWGQCFAPLYNRAWSLNPGIYERNLITNSLPDPRLYTQSLNNLTRTYAGWLREYHHIKDSNMRSLNYTGSC